MCEISFFYNDEKLGAISLTNYDSYLVYPFAEIKGEKNANAKSECFFDMSSTKFKVLI
jgi:hypothetical protein